MGYIGILLLPATFQHKLAVSEWFLPKLAFAKIEIVGSLVNSLLFSSSEQYQLVTIKIENFTISTLPWGHEETISCRQCSEYGETVYYSWTYHIRPLHNRLLRITDLVNCEFSPLKSVLHSVTTFKIVCNANSYHRLALPCRVDT